MSLHVLYMPSNDNIHSSILACVVKVHYDEEDWLFAEIRCSAVLLWRVSFATVDERRHL